MKYIKRLGPLALAAAALMAFAANASALVTSGGTKVPSISATSTNSQLHGTVDITCTHSEVIAIGRNAANTANEAGGTTGRVTKLSFIGCDRHVTVTAPGHIKVASDGTVTSTGARVTVQTVILGFPVHCIYATNNTVVGKLTEGVAPAKLHIGSAAIPQEATSSLCGDDALWTGTYTVISPPGEINIH